VRAALIALLGAAFLAAPLSARAAAPFDRVVVVVFENKSAEEVLGSPASAPTFRSLARRYALLPDYAALAHPSLPNYLALISGSTHGIRRSCSDCIVSARNLADTLEARGLTWKVYAEGLPSPGFTGSNRGRYVKRHNPFLYFRDVVSRPARLARVVPYTRLRRDIAARRMPDFSLVVPDNCHNGHDCPLNVSDAWLKRFLPGVLRSPQMRRGVVFVIFDEGRGSQPGAPGGRIAAMAVGPTVKPGSRAPGHLTHYSLLRTIEDAFRLPRLGQSLRAVPVRGIWR